MKERWSSRMGFILAASGASIGLGNIWRFPYVAYENGGGAFLIPYLLALLFLGIPFVILQMGMGHKYRVGTPYAFFKVHKYCAWIGWLETFIAAIIAVCYVVIIGWAISYFFFSFTLHWGENTGDFFYTQYLGFHNEATLSFSHIQAHIILPLFIAWFITFMALIFGIGHGIEKVNYIFVPLLFILCTVLIIRAINLPGASIGLNYLFTPDFEKLLNPKVWMAAFGQIFFTLSIGYGVLVTYASYLPKESDISNNASMIAFINCGFSILSGILVFSVLGNMSHEAGKPMDQVAGAGIGLTFVTLPNAFNHMPEARVIAPLFFLSIIFAGTSSHISIVEAVVRAFCDKLGWPRPLIVSGLCFIGFLCSLIFTTNGGLSLIGVVDYFSNQILLIGVCTIELVCFGWLCRELHGIQQHCNQHSDFNVGRLWIFCLKYAGVAILIFLLVRYSLKPYRYEALEFIGWTLTGCVLLASVLCGFHNKWVHQS